MLKRLCPFLFCLLSWQFSAAQEVLNIEQKQIDVKWIDQEIKIDGSLNEQVWESAGSANDFWQYFPTDSLMSDSQTEIKMLYDSKYLYLGIKVYAKGNDFIVPSLKRDFDARGNDNINLLFDTYKDGANAFFFGSNSEGVQREALISGGGANYSDFRNTWDVKWENISKKDRLDIFISLLVIALTSSLSATGLTKNASPPWPSAVFWRSALFSLERYRIGRSVVVVSCRIT